MLKKIITILLLCSLLSSPVSAEESSEQAQIVPFGELAAALAASRPDGEQWMGGVTSNPRIQCDSFVAFIYAAAGANLDFSGNIVVNDDDFRRIGAYHSIGDGYVPKPGDMVDWVHHVGIYLGDGMVCSRQSGDGVKTHPLSVANGIFGAQQGWGSVSEATNNKMVVFDTSDWNKMKNVWEAVKAGVPNTAANMKDAMYEIADVKIPWNFEVLANFGTVLNDLADKITDFCKDGLQYLKPALGLTILLCAIIDFVPIFIIGGMTINGTDRFFIEKIIRYGFLFFLFYNWDTILNDFFLDFIKNSVITISPSAADNVVNAITQPQLIVQKGMSYLMPALNEVGKLTLFGVLNNLPRVTAILIMSTLSMLVLTLLGLFILLSYINFYICGIFSLIGLAFSPLALKKITNAIRLFAGARRGMGSATIRLITICLTVAAALEFLQNMPPVNINFNGLDYLNADDYKSLAEYYNVCLTLIGISSTIYFSTKKVGDLLE